MRGARKPVSDYFLYGAARRNIAFCSEVTEAGERKEREREEDRVQERERKIETKETKEAFCSDVSLQQGLNEG